jgi:holliday junction DNA helicase RuvA
MFEYISGDLIEINPSYVIIDAGGIGYFINISLSSYSLITREQKGKMVKLFVHQVIREDAHVMFGFFDVNERSLFRQLISVSGIGANTARVILSSLSADEIRQAIVSANVTVLKNIKGIGAKTAERIIVDLKDKMAKDSSITANVFHVFSAIKEEAMSALLTLGFPKSTAEKIVDKIIQESPNIAVEGLVKEALKRL